MGTRSFNIIKKSNKLYVFWCHWDGNTITDTILKWNLEDLQKALKKIAKSERPISSLLTRKEIEHQASDLAEGLSKAIINGNNTDYYLHELHKLDFVKLYDDCSCLEVPCFTLLANDIPEISYIALRDYCIKKYKYPPINDFEVINLIDFDNQEIAMERDIYEDSIKDYRKISLDTKYSFKDVRDKGIEFLVGLR